MEPTESILAGLAPTYQPTKLEQAFDLIAQSFSLRLAAGMPVAEVAAACKALNNTIPLLNLQGCLMLGVKVDEDNQLKDNQWECTFFLPRREPSRSAELNLEMQEIREMLGEHVATTAATKICMPSVPVSELRFV